MPTTEFEDELDVAAGCFKCEFCTTGDKRMFYRSTYSFLTKSMNRNTLDSRNKED